MALSVEIIEMKAIEMEAMEIVDLSNLSNNWNQPASWVQVG